MPVNLTSKAIVLVAAFCALSACQATDLTSMPKYAAVVGTEYRTKTELYAVGVFRDINKKELGWIHVLPVAQTGPEIAFARSIPVGHVLRVLAVRKTFKLFDNGIQFIVAVDGLRLPAGIEVFVSLYGYMQSTDGFPDASRFERISRPAS